MAPPEVVLAELDTSYLNTTPVHPDLFDFDGQCPSQTEDHNTRICTKSDIETIDASRVSSCHPSVYLNDDGNTATGFYAYDQYLGCCAKGRCNNTGWNHATDLVPVTDIDIGDNVPRTQNKTVAQIAGDWPNMSNNPGSGCPPGKVEYKAGWYYGPKNLNNYGNNYRSDTPANTSCCTAGFKFEPPSNPADRPYLKVCPADGVPTAIKKRGIQGAKVDANKMVWNPVVTGITNVNIDGSETVLVDGDASNTKKASNCPGAYVGTNKAGQLECAIVNKYYYCCKDCVEKPGVTQGKWENTDIIHVGETITLSSQEMTRTSSTDENAQALTSSSSVEQIQSAANTISKSTSVTNTTSNTSSSSSEASLGDMFGLSGSSSSSQTNTTSSTQTNTTSNTNTNTESLATAMSNELNNVATKLQESQSLQSTETQYHAKNSPIYIFKYNVNMQDCAGNKYILTMDVEHHPQNKKPCCLPHAHLGEGEELSDDEKNILCDNPESTECFDWKNWCCLTKRNITDTDKQSSQWWPQCVSRFPKIEKDEDFCPGS